ncbi:DUF6351 family protein [Jiangella alkaliphila]|uniref:DUF6351 domain-containing protein n=1 Tax=Jiangella alkaliphila TaxID=419479 RepID=A0A1H2JWA6_9ACTN|nr:DUF6351 family protein [Jiangella alkaliphila]SDU60426.1 hypothetical protein SAMN04488563_3127 [Jiangella alkaliphila]
MHRFSVAAIAASVLALALVSAAAPAAPRGLELSTLSGRADTVTGVDTLLRVDVPRDVPLHRVTVRLNGDDVTEAFVADPARRTLTGLVDGLRLGPNTLVASAPGRYGDRLDVVNHPQEGPVFSGPHQQPYVCETAQFTVPVIGGTLGPPLDEHCTVAPRVDYFYRTTAGAYAPWPDGATSYPADLASTTTSAGVTVPFIVRMETDSANRAVVQTSLLHDPLGEPEPTPTLRAGGWNGRAVFTLGGGCSGGWYRSGAGTGGVTDAFLLGQGYALMSSSLNVFGNNCHDLTAAESAMMTKELFVERYGPVEHTIGFGCSGGSYQAHQITDNYPGIFDGIVVGCSFPEVGFGTVDFISDAWLLHEYFTNDATLTWSQEQQRQVAGFATYATLPAMAVSAGRIDPRRFCGVLPAEQRYDPVTNPGGARCDVYDHAINVYGADPETGFARRPLDNVGIQYGLATLNDGTISPEQFLELNERIGGFDADANIVAERTVADLDATRIAYRTGRLTNGGGGLADVPIIDYRAYFDDQPAGDIHVRYHTNSLRERLENANGTAANHVSLLEDARYGLFSTGSPLLQHAITQMDAWLTTLAADDSGADRIDQIVAARPAELVEGCMTRAAAPEFVAETLDRDPAGECERLYPSASFPREVAGESVAADVVKCRLKEPERDDYAVEWTSAQWERLATIFAGGVCDYTVPGAGQQGLAGTWLRF